MGFMQHTPYTPKFTMSEDGKTPSPLVPHHVGPMTPQEGRKNDQGKDRYDLIPPLALHATVKVLTHGAFKYNEAYNEENWRKVSNPKRRYFGAAMRHLWAWYRGEKLDPETGESHLAHAVTNILFLLEKEQLNELKD